MPDTWKANAKHSAEVKLEIIKKCGQTSFETKGWQRGLELEDALIMSRADKTNVDNEQRIQGCAFNKWGDL
jgi:hypothetical protein